MVVIFASATTFIPLGLEYAAAAVIGIVFGERISFVFVLAAYKLHRKKEQQKVGATYPSMTIAAAYSAIFSISLPLTFNRITESFLRLQEERG